MRSALPDPVSDRHDTREAGTELREPSVVE
jgi:hypothetical protein